MVDSNYPCKRESQGDSSGTSTIGSIGYISSISISIGGKSIRIRTSIGISIRIGISISIRIGISSSCGCRCCYSSWRRHCGVSSRGRVGRKATAQLGVKSQGIRA